MADIYNTEGLGPEQVAALDRIAAAHSAAQREDGAPVDPRMDRFTSIIKEQLAGLGADISDPRTHFAVLAGASIMYEYTFHMEELDPLVQSSMNVLIKAIVNARPVRDLE
ncbi:MAG TPA: hypothetical protein VLF40_06090 [Candidatus Saccharimonadales bacterium]|nr:hypothetical protein [Candidatus Saccharimonadales bacterium]